MKGRVVQSLTFGRAGGNRTHVACISDRCITFLLPLGMNWPHIIFTTLSYRSFGGPGWNLHHHSFKATLLQSIGLTRAQPTHDCQEQRTPKILVPLAGAAPTPDVWKTPALLLRHSGLCIADVPPCNLQWYWSRRQAMILQPCD